MVFAQEPLMTDQISVLFIAALTAIVSYLAYDTLKYNELSKKKFYTLLFKVDDTPGTINLAIALCSKQQAV